MMLGPVMVDLEGIELSATERELLRHPGIGGVILFSRNYLDRDQLKSLIAEIHVLRTPSLIIGVDHEGGRIQRFREGFTPLPPARAIGRLYDIAPREARVLAAAAAYVMARELRAVGVDFSFAPVLDLDWGVSAVIGNRAFHDDPDIVADLARHYILGLRRAGMAAVGKHFPGHGAVAEDSHTALPIDERDLSALMAKDLVPFGRLIDAGLMGIMPAHVVYAKADSHPAGFSPFWLKHMLRKVLKFQGAIFSDDLSMAAAMTGGDMVARVRLALEAGCDMVLVCRHSQVESVLESLEGYSDSALPARLASFQASNMASTEPLEQDRRWQTARARLDRLNTRRLA